LRAQPALECMAKDQILRFQQELSAWYRASKRDLPWRNTRDPYRIWVSEVMLQQTQVATVIPYYHRFMTRYPSVHDLARSDLQAVLKSWEGLGYYGRARNLHKAAGIVVAQHGGKIPDQWEAFRSLPGVGDYIAAAVLSMAFEGPYPVIDGNVKRVLSRLLLLEDPVNHSASARRFHEAAERFFDRPRPGEFNQAMMELGALICQPRKPRCGACPVHHFCLAHQQGEVAEFPKRVTKPPPPLYPIAVGVVFKQGRLLITRRRPEGLLGGLWEFPGGKIRDGETPEAACMREIKEEVNLTVAIDSHLCRVRHAYTHFKIDMEVFCCSYASGKVRLNGPVDYRWIRIDEMAAYPFPRADHKFMPQLKDYVSRRLT
jgi:A/G-specific adenine glycosylase